jgi:hypothetical protein
MPDLEDTTHFKTCIDCNRRVQSEHTWFGSGANQICMGCNDYVIVPANPESPATIDFGINLSTERMILPPGMRVRGFSINGTRWTGVGENVNFNARLERLLNNRQGLTLHITTEALAGNQPQAGSTVTFQPIEPRPRRGKYAVNLLHFADNTGMTNGAWTMYNTNVRNNHFFAPNFDYAQPDFEANARGKTAGRYTKDYFIGEFLHYYALTGIPLVDLNERGRRASDVWFIRYPPVISEDAAGKIYFPASSHRRLSVRGVLAVPRVSVRNVRINNVQTPAIPVARGLAYHEISDPTNVTIVNARGYNITAHGTYHVWRPANANGRNPASAKSPPLTLP